MILSFKYNFIEMDDFLSFLERKTRKDATDVIFVRYKGISCYTITLYSKFYLYIKLYIKLRHLDNNRNMVSFLDAYSLKMFGENLYNLGYIEFENDGIHIRKCDQE